MNTENDMAQCLAVCEIKRGLIRLLVHGYDGSRGAQKAYNSLRFRNHENPSL